VEVVAPVPWFPFNRLFRPQASEVPRSERDGEFRVHHPRVFSIPLIGKFLDAVFYFACILRFLRRLRSSFVFDVIDAHFAYPDGVAAVLLGRALGCPVVVTLRGNEVVTSRYLLRRLQIRYALRSARVIAVSESLRRLAGTLGVSPEHVRVIPNGVDGDRFRPGDRQAARSAFGLAADRQMLLSVGSFVPGKGHELVLDLLPELRRRCPRLLYVAIGNRGGGDDRLSAIEQRVRREGLEQCVRLEVGRPHEEMPTWLAAADVFCLATEREGSPNAILEALACGLPVVATDVGGVAEVVRDGDDGFLVPYFDSQAFARAVVAALEKEWDRRAIAQRAAARTWEAAAAAVIEELGRAIESD
jgi:glycosyltransferase involved in cell wall biosynthesis